MTNLQEVGMYDWDTSFAIRYADANAAIVNAWSKIDDDAKNVTVTDEGYTIAAALGPWQLKEGGDGRNVWMTIPVISGKLTGGQAAVDLADAVFEVEINLDYVPDPAKQQTKQLIAAANGDATNVRDVTGVTIGDIQKAIVKQVFDAWLSTNLGAFNHVFHYLDLSDEVDEDADWKFIKPTSVSYAVTDKGTLDTSVFGVLTMTAGRPTPANHQVSPDAIPAGCNSGFNIAGPIFTTKMLLTGAALQFEQPASVTSQTVGSDARQAAFDSWVAANFIVANDGMSVTNKTEMVFGNFVDDGGNTRTLKVDASDFKLSINYGLLEVDFTKLNYEFSPGINVSINYKQHFEVYLADGKADGKGKKVFALKNVDRDCSVEITKSKSVQITEIITGVALSIAGAVFGGLAGEAVGSFIKGAAAAGEAGAQAVADGVVMSMTDSAEASADAATLTAQAGAQAGAEAAGAVGGKMSGFLARIAPKLIGAMVGAGIGGVIAAIPDYVVLAASDDFNKLPAFDEFAAQAVQAHAWPGSTGFELKSARLATALQLGGDLSW